MGSSIRWYAYLKFDINLSQEWAMTLNGILVPPVYGQLDSVALLSVNVKCLVI